MLSVYIQHLVNVLLFNGTRESAGCRELDNHVVHPVVSWKQHVNRSQNSIAPDITTFVSSQSGALFLPKVNSVLHVFLKNGDSKAKNRCEKSLKFLLL
jgi:hypothetical protein